MAYTRKTWKNGEIITAEDLNNLETGIGEAKNTADAAEKKHRTVMVSLPVASWSNRAQTVAASGVTASNSVICAPAPASHEAYCAAGVYCSAQAAGKLTFKCKTKPAVALAVNVMIVGG